MNEILQHIYLGEKYIVKETWVQYIITSGILDENRITEESEVTPTQSWNKGDEFLGKEWCPKSRRTIEKIKIRNQGVWELSSDNIVDSPILEDHAKYILSQLEPAKNYFQQLCVNTQDYLIKFCLSWHIAPEHGSYELSSQTLSRISVISQLAHYSFIAKCEDE